MTENFGGVVLIALAVLGAIATALVFRWKTRRWKLASKRRRHAPIPLVAFVPDDGEETTAPPRARPGRPTAPRERRRETPVADQPAGIPVYAERVTGADGGPGDEHERRERGQRPRKPAPAAPAPPDAPELPAAALRFAPPGYAGSQPPVAPASPPANGMAAGGGNGAANGAARPHDGRRKRQQRDRLHDHLRPRIDSKERVRAYSPPTITRGEAGARQEPTAPVGPGAAPLVPDGTLQFLPGRFEVIAGDAPGHEIRFVRTGAHDPTEITFGRSEGPPYTHVQLRQATVSRTHARMVIDGSTWLLTNLSATNPLSVNGRQLAGVDSSVVLRDGDRIEMGEVAFRYRER